MNMTIFIWFTDNVEFSMKFIPKVETKKGKQYLQFSEVKLDFTTTRWVRTM